MRASGKDIMVTAAYVTEGKQHPKTVLFFLGGWWKLPVLIGAGVPVAWAAVAGVRWVVGHWPQTGAFAISGGPAVILAVCVVAVILAALLGGGGRHGGRRR